MGTNFLKNFTTEFSRNAWIGRQLVENEYQRGGGRIYSCQQSQFNHED